MPETPTSQKFQISAEVRPEDIDELDHVNNAVYLRWVQAAAVAHWREIAPADMQDDTLWVVVRHEIDYKSPAVRSDRLVVETWVGAATRITFERHTEILRASDRTLLARARTLWCPIDARARKPKRVDERVRALFSIASA